MGNSASARGKMQIPASDILLIILRLSRARKANPETSESGKKRLLKLYVQLYTNSFECIVQTARTTHKPSPITTLVDDCKGYNEC